MSAARYIAGTLLIASSTIAMGWWGWLRLGGHRVGNAPFEAWPRLAPVMRRSVATWITAHLLSLAGFAALTVILTASDDAALSVVALVLLILTVVFVILEGTHHMTVGIWSAERYVDEGTRPGFTIPVEAWANRSFQILYYLLGMAGIGVYGAAMIVTGLPARWAGWIGVGWAVALLTILAFRRTMWGWALLVPVQLLVGLTLVGS